jgi:hypothetical protein
MTNEELAAIATQRQHIDRCRDDLEAAAVEYARIYVEGPETYSAWELMFDRFIAAAIAMREARKGTVAE